MIRLKGETIYGVRDSLTSCLPAPPSGGALSQLSDSGQTLSEDSGVDIAESGHVSKDSSPHSSRTGLPRDTQGGGGDNPSKPVRGCIRKAVLGE